MIADSVVVDLAPTIPTISSTFTEDPDTSIASSSADDPNPRSTSTHTLQTTSDEPTLAVIHSRPSASPATVTQTITVASNIVTTALLQSASESSQRASNTPKPSTIPPPTPAPFPNGGLVAGVVVAALAILVLSVGILYRRFRRKRSLNAVPHTEKNGDGASPVAGSCSRTAIRNSHRLCFVRLDRILFRSVAPAMWRAHASFLFPPTFGRRGRNEEPFHHTSRRDGQGRIHDFSDRKSTRLNSSHSGESRMPSSA